MANKPHNALKLIYLVRGADNEFYETFQQRIRNEFMALMKHKNVLKLSYTITTEPPPAISVIPFRKTKLTAITLKMNDEQVIDHLTKITGCRYLFC